MLSTFDKILVKFSDILWGMPTILLLLTLGLALTVATGFFQFARFGYIWKNTFGKIVRKEAGEGDRGIVSAIEAVTIAIGNVVGMGNIAGVATAIAVGGPGAVFWMWMIALVGMMLKMTEVSLAVHYRRRDAHGNPFGGPTYYIKYGIGENRGEFMRYLAKALNFLFIFGLLTGSLIMSQCYNVSEAVSNTFHVNQLGVAVFYTIMVYIMIAGGLKSLSKFAMKMVPTMCTLYFLAGFGIILTNINNLLPTIALIFKSAFGGAAATGGFAGATVMVAIQKGFARALFSNEAGQGTSPMIHATATTNHPISQGMYGVFEVFVDSIVICSITAIAILITGEWSSGVRGITLSLNAFSSVYRFWGQAILAFTIFLFGVTTTSGCFTYQYTVLGYLFEKNIQIRDKILLAYRWFYPIPALGMVVYALQKGLPPEIIWTFVDVATGMPTVVNVTALIFLFPKFLEILKDYKARYMGIGEIDPNFKPFVMEDK